MVCLQAEASGSTGQNGQAGLDAGAGGVHVLQLAKQDTAAHVGRSPRAIDDAENRIDASPSVQNVDYPPQELQEPAGLASDLAAAGEDRPSGSDATFPTITWSYYQRCEPGLRDVSHSCATNT